MVKDREQVQVDETGKNTARANLPVARVLLLAASEDGGLTFDHISNLLV